MAAERERKAKAAQQEQEKKAAEEARKIELRRIASEAKAAVPIIAPTAPLLPITATTAHRDPSADLVADLFALLSAERAARVSAETKLVKAEMVAVKAQCVVCLDQDANHAATPCGHLVLCEVCVAGIRGSQCPVCRATVASYVRIYHL